MNNYDYILAITYEFLWIKSSGKMLRSSSKDAIMNFYVGDISGPINTFVEGYDLENTHFYHDIEGKTVNITDNNFESGMEVSIMKAVKNEYGIT